MADKAREAALYALGRCRRDGAWSSATIDAAVKKYELDRRDAAFAARLTLCVLENRSLCDYYVGAFSSTPVNRLEPVVLDIMRAGICQILFMDRVPASAAVNSSVELCKGSVSPKAAGLVNAVMRRISEKSGALPEIPGEGTAKYLAVKYSHPQWLADRLVSEKGYDFTRAFFAADNSTAGLCLMVNTLKTTPEQLKELFAQSGLNCRAFPAMPDCLIADNPGGVGALPGFGEGLFYVQDPAAAGAVKAAGLKEGMSVLDACAAPGGKSFAAAMEMGDTGDILACDIHEKKLSLVSSGARRLGISIVRTCARDARSPLAEQFDAVICDVPCSGMGVIRKKPEIRYKSAESIANLPEIQSAVLSAASKSVKSGGTLLYSTCTVLREENEGVTERFLAENPDFTCEDFEIFGKTARGNYTCWPNEDGTDGFYLCLMRKKA